MPTAKRKQPIRSPMRNPLHDHPLMKRGGVHEKSAKAQRQQDKQALKRLWRYSKTNLDLFLNNAIQSQPRESGTDPCHSRASGADLRHSRASGNLSGLARYRYIGPPLARV